MDKVSIERINGLHPKLVPIAMAAFTEASKRLTGSSILRIAYGLRSYAEQSNLYAQGRTKPGKIVTNSKPGFSYHNYGLAVDIVLLIDKDGNGTFESASWDTLKDFDGDKMADWMEVVSVFKAAGFKWGGDFNSLKDYPHFEMSFGLSINDLIARTKANKIIRGTKWLQL